MFNTRISVVSHDESVTKSANITRVSEMMQKKKNDKTGDRFGDLISKVRNCKFSSRLSNAQFLFQPSVVKRTTLPITPK